MEGDPGFEATKKVMSKLHLDNIEFSRVTSKPYEEQFWEQFDVLMDLSEENMIEQLPYFVADPTN